MFAAQLSMEIIRPTHEMYDRRADSISFGLIAPVLQSKRIPLNVAVGVNKVETEQNVLWCDWKPHLQEYHNQTSLDAVVANDANN